MSSSYVVFTSSSTPSVIPSLLPPCESALSQSCSFQKTFVSPPLPCLLCSTDNAAFSFFSDNVQLQYNCNLLHPQVWEPFNMPTKSSSVHPHLSFLFPFWCKRRGDLFFLRPIPSPTSLNPLSQKPRHLDSFSLTLGIIGHHVLLILPFSVS